MPQRRHPDRNPPWRKPLVSRSTALDVGALDAGDGEGWQLTNQFANVARATTLAVLSSSVSIAQGFNQHNDEIVPLASSESSMPGTFGQRGRHETRFIKWQQVEELPSSATPVALDDGEWIPPRTVIPEPSIIFLAADEVCVPAAVGEEEYWWHAESALAKVPQLAQTGEDELVTVAAAIVEEDIGILPGITGITAKYLAASDDEIPQQATTLAEEEYWIPLATKIEPIVGYTIIHADEVFQSIATEEGGWEPPYRIQSSPQSLPFADIEIVPQPTPLNIDESYHLTFYVSPNVYKVSAQFLVEDDAPALSAPVTTTLVEWLVRARRRGVR
jgi:hypothetical protein